MKPQKRQISAVVKPMFEGNEYYLYVYETYKDIRLVVSTKCYW